MVKVFSNFDIAPVGTFDFDTAPPERERRKGKKKGNSRMFERRNESYLTAEERLESGLINQQMKERRQRKSLGQRREKLQREEYRDEHPYRYAAKEKIRGVYRSYQRKSLQSVIGKKRLKKPSRASFKPKTGFGDYFTL